MSLIFTLTLTAPSAPPPLPPPPPPPPPQPQDSPVRPRKSLVSRSLFCHVERFPEAKPRYSGEIPAPTWGNEPSSAMCRRDMWDCEEPVNEMLAVAPTVAAFWRSAVADRCAEVGCVLTWKFWKGEVIKFFCCVGGGGGGCSWKNCGEMGDGIWRWWISGLIWSGLWLGLLGLGFWGESHEVREMWVGGFGKCCCCWWWVEKAGKKEHGFCGWRLRSWLVEFITESLALSSAKASQNALWVMKLSFLKIKPNNLHYHQDMTHQF